MFANGNYGSQNNGNGVNINTNIKTLYSDFSSLTIGLWDQQLSLRFNPCTGVDMNGFRQYDSNHKASTALIPEKALMFKSAIDKSIMPLISKIEASESVDKPVMIGTALGSPQKRNMLVVELSNDTNGKAALYLKLYQLLKEDNSCDPQNIFVFKFGTNTLVYDYNSNNGTGREEYIPSEFLLFYELLSKITDIYQISAHGTRYSDAIRSRYSSSNNNAMNRPQNVGYGTVPQAIPVYDAPSSTYGAMDDLGLPFN